MRRRITKSCVLVLWWDHLALGIFKSFLDNELREGVFRTFGIPKPKRIFYGSSSLRKTIGTVKGLLLGVCFVAEGPVRRNTFGRLKQERCRNYQSGSFIVYFQMHQLKDEKTNWPMLICVMIVTGCKGQM